MLFLSDTSALAQREHAFSVFPPPSRWAVYYLFCVFCLLFSFPTFNRDEVSGHCKGVSPFHRRPFFAAALCRGVQDEEAEQWQCAGKEKSCSFRCAKSSVVDALCGTSAHNHLRDAAEHRKRQVFPSCWRRQTLPFKHCSTPTQGANICLFGFPLCATTTSVNVSCHDSFKCTVFHSDEGRYYWIRVKFALGALHI